MPDYEKLEKLYEQYEEGRHVYYADGYEHYFEENYVQV